MKTNLPLDVRTTLDSMVASTDLSEDFIKQNVEPFLEELPIEDSGRAAEALEIIRRRELHHGDAVLVSQKLANLRFNLKRCLAHLAPPVGIDTVLVAVFPEPLHVTLVGIGVVLKALMIFREGLEVELSDDEVRILLALMAWEREGNAPSIDKIHSTFDRLLTQDRIDKCLNRLEIIGCIRRPLQVVEGKPHRIVILNETVVYEAQRPE